MLVDRRGFGDSPAVDVDGWPTDVEDVAGLLNELGGAHLVGQSYGAVVSLLIAGGHPDLIGSLVAIEPPLYGIAVGDPVADEAAGALRPVYDRAAELTAEEFVSAWGAALGMPGEAVRSWTATFGGKEWAAAEASRRERWPGDAPIDLEALTAAAFPKVVVRGGWRDDVAPGRGRAGEGFRVTCEAVAAAIGARIVVFEQSAHNPQLEEPERFNALLRGVWAEAEALAQPG